MGKQTTSLTWILSLCFAKGMPRVFIFVISLVMLRQMELSILEVLSCVSSFYLPWVLKVWWVKCTDKMLSRRHWILFTQFLLGISFGALSLTKGNLLLLIICFQLVAWLTAIHNVAVDKYLRIFQSSRQHAVARELSRKFSIAIGQGILVMLVGNLQVIYRLDRLFPWYVIFYIVAALFLLLFFWHLYILTDDSSDGADVVFSSQQFPVYYAQTGLFFLCYIFAQGMIGKASILFTIDMLNSGGLGLSPQEFGLVMGTIGVLGLTIGGLGGNKMIQRNTLPHCIWPMAILMFVPGVVYLILSYLQPQDLGWLSICILTEQLALGFGYASYLSILKTVSNRESAKSLMALSLMLSCLVTGFILDVMSYHTFFIITLVLSILSPLSVLTIKQVFHSELKEE